MHFCLLFGDDLHRYLQIVPAKEEKEQEEEVKSLRFTASALILAFLTSCSAFPKEEDIYVDYTAEDSRRVELRSVDIQGLSLTLTSVTLSNREYEGVKSTGKGYFYVIDYALTNRSNSTRSFDPDHIILVTDLGDRYTVKNYSHKKFKKYTEPITGIKENETVTSRVIYEMPVATTPDTLVIEGLKPGRDQIIDLPIPPKNADRY